MRCLRTLAGYLAGCLAGYLVLFVVTAVAAENAVSNDGLDAALGKALFKRQWVPAPASTDASDGLGPLFNARSCLSCHNGGGGSYRGRGIDGRIDLQGAVVRFGTADGAGDPYYGIQLQTKAVTGLSAEGSVTFLPQLRVQLAGPPLSPGVRQGVRQAPTLFGRWIFDTIPDAEILKREDPNDRDHDGISGRANRVGTGIGRYGWKAGLVHLNDQIARAFMLDLGMSSSLEPRPRGDCTAVEVPCSLAPTGESPVTEGYEVPSTSLDLLAAYVRSLTATPVADADAEGERLFAAARCNACHVPTLQDQSGTGQPAFTDLLLHDMGHDLDDGIAEAGAASSEWRTAPLIGRNVQRGARYLHDGSAGTIAEAIARHGGEAAGARDAFANLSASDRAKLIQYVGRL